MYLYIDMYDIHVQYVSIVELQNYKFYDIATAGSAAGNSSPLAALCGWPGRLDIGSWLEGVRSTTDEVVYRMCIIYYRVYIYIYDCIYIYIHMIGISTMYMCMSPIYGDIL